MAAAIPWISSLAAILRGQQQGTQQSDQYQQELQARQQKEQLDNAALMAKLKEFSGEQEAYGKLPAEAQPYAHLGVLPQWMQLQQQQQLNQAAARGYQSWAENEPDARRKALLNSASQMATGGTPDAMIVAMLKNSGAFIPKEIEELNQAKTGQYKAKTTQLELFNQMLQDPALRPLVLKAMQSMGGATPSEVSDDAGAAGSGEVDLGEAPAP